ncbi:MAG: Gfo/Idh/MocA family protein [Armatimonadota bacterium]
MAFQLVLAGCGARGKMWAEVIDRADHVTVAACVDTKLSNARALAGPRGRPAFDDLGAALGAVRTDAVLVVTPPATHREVIELLLRQRVPILAEKPLADKLSDAVELVKRAQDAAVPLSLSVQFRYLPVSVRMRQILAEQRFGRPGFAQFTYLRNRDPYAPHLNWGTRYPVAVRHPMLVDQTIHHFDLIRFCYQAEPVWMETHTWNPSWSLYGHDSNVASLMELRNGVMVQYLGTWTGGWNELQFEWRTDCERGIVTQKKLFSDLWTAATGDQALMEVPLEPFDAFFDDSARLLRDFVDSITMGRPVPCDGWDHLQTLAMVFAAMESSETGSRVDMKVFRQRYGIPQPS